MTNELLSPEDLEKVRQFETIREQWRQLVTAAKKVPTPDNVLEEMDEWLVPSYEYMESQMDKFHPRRAVKFHEASYDRESYTYSFTVEIIDVNTGESRLGTGVHPIIVYERNSTTLKHPKVIRQLMKNAKKAALTLAIRDAYAHFGIAADKYGMQLREQPSRLQMEEFENTIADLPTHLQSALREKAKTHFADTIDSFIEEIQKRKTSASPTPSTS